MGRSRPSRPKRPTLQDALRFAREGRWTFERDPISKPERVSRLDDLKTHFGELYKKHVSKVRNLDILVIKCHLVVEFVLNQFIDLAAPREGLLEIERFSFKQKAAIVFMLEFSADPVFWSNIDLLNSVRNKFAHRLEVDRDEIDRMIRLNFRDFEDSEWVANLTEARRISALKSITGAMCWYLLGFVEGISMSIDWQSGSVGGE